MTAIEVRPIIEQLGQLMPWRHGGVVRVESLTRALSAQRVFPSALRPETCHEITRRVIVLAVLEARGQEIPATLIEENGEIVTPRPPGCPHVEEEFLVPHPDWRKKRPRR